MWLLFAVVDHAPKNISVLKLPVMVTAWVWSTWCSGADHTMGVCALLKAFTLFNSHCQRGGWHWVAWAWIWDISAIKILSHERKISITDKANWAGSLVSLNKMKDAHESLQGQDFCVGGSDAEVRRVFQRLMISFQLQFLQLNPLGRKAITTSDKVNLWGVTITLFLD